MMGYFTTAPEWDNNKSDVENHDNLNAILQSVEDKKQQVDKSFWIVKTVAVSALYLLGIIWLIIQITRR